VHVLARGYARERISRVFPEGFASIPSVKILGIDLSSQPANTAACVIDFREGKAQAKPPHIGCDDEELDSLIARVDAIGIDAPFGWPEAFAKAVAGWINPVGDNTLRDQLRFRATDFEVTRQTGLRPLSVSTDQIALPAMRAMALLHRHGVTDKSGDGRFFEVYPAAALFGWQIPHRGYKGAGDDRGAARQSILQRLREKFPRLEVSDDYALTDHALDALIAALVTIAATEGNTRCPSPEQLSSARTEGWIHLPTQG
jgi:predicted nuclease with RNAse H fold